MQTHIRRVLGKRAGILQRMKLLDRTADAIGMLVLRKSLLEKVGRVLHAAQLSCSIAGIKRIDGGPAPLALLLKVGSLALGPIILWTGHTMV